MVTDRAKQLHFSRRGNQLVTSSSLLGSRRSLLKLRDTHGSSRCPSLCRPGIRMCLLYWRWVQCVVILRLLLDALAFALICEQQWSSFTRVHAYSESLYGTSCLSAAVWEMAILLYVHLSTSASMISKLLEVVFYVG